ncbi:MAG: radical SAM protein [Candidatus Thermoplasmatota archaeon]
MRPGLFKPYYFYRLLRWKMGNRDPLTAVAKITNRCNLRCDHCPWWKRDIDDATTEEWKELLDEARERGVIHLIFEGGEPTLRDDLDVLIDHAKDLGMLVMVITNGTTDLAKFEPDSYWISVEGIGETHDKNREKGVFDRMVQNLRENREVNKTACVTLHKYNASEIEEIADCFSPLTDGVWFNFMYPYEDSKDIALSPSEQEEVAQDIIDLKDKGGYNIINSYSYLRSVGKNMGNKRETCPSFLTLLIDADMTMRQGCTAEQIEDCKCELCNAGCYGELTQAMKLKPDAINFLKKTVGLESDKLLWLK